MLEDKSEYHRRVDPHPVRFAHTPQSLLSTEPDCLDESSQVIAQFPEVSYLASITGEYDVMVDVMCRHTQHLKDFLTNRLAKVKGVKEYQTMFILHVYKIAQPDLRLAKSLAPAKDVAPIQMMKSIGTHESKKAVVLEGQNSCGSHRSKPEVRKLLMVDSEGHYPIPQSSREFIFGTRRKRYWVFINSEFECQLWNPR
jgi:hypothetical protein